MSYFLEKTREILAIYWELARIVAPITIATQALMETGVIAAIAPAFAPLMDFYGLPPELALALLAGMLIGIWNAAAMLFVLAPADALSAADVTVFSALVLFIHALPIEQQIIRRAGAGLVATTASRVAGGLIYAALLRWLFDATGWLSEPAAPAWTPAPENAGWGTFLTGLGETLVMILVILVVLVWLLEGLKASGLMTLLHKAMAPPLRLMGVRGEAVHLTTVGLFLGVAYGGGLLIREARGGQIPPRQVFLSCVFMGFAHSILEDTLVVLALGADLTSVLVGRMIFAMAATALIAAVMTMCAKRREA